MATAICVHIEHDHAHGASRIGCQHIRVARFVNVWINARWSIGDKGNHWFYCVFSKMEHRGPRKPLVLYSFQQHGAKVAKKHWFYSHVFECKHMTSLRPYCKRNLKSLKKHWFYSEGVVKKVSVPRIWPRAKHSLAIETIYRTLIRQAV